MKAGDKVKVKLGYDKHPDWREFKLEEFRYALGIFRSEEHRVMGKFTPLCELYEGGDDSETEYMPHMGEYFTNPVPVFYKVDE